MKKRVLIVEDSILMQRMIGDILAESADFEVCGYARDVVEGWAKFNKLKPDLVTLDFELPGENGLALLERIMNNRPVPVLMLSAHTQEGAELTVKSLSLGAVDFFTKPSGAISIDIYQYRDLLLDKLKAAAKSKLPSIGKSEYSEVCDEKGQFYLGVASSTGGVRALNYLIPAISEKSCLKIVVVQHMPKFFTTTLAVHLNEHSSMFVKEARDGDILRNGEVLIAPGGHHIKVDTDGDRIVLSDEPPRHGVKPSADFLFESMADVLKNKAIGVILTGMGRDGAAGLQKIKMQGGKTIVQDPHEAAIGSMPQSAIDLGIVDFVLPLSAIPQKLKELTHSE